jgi:hypothetical protein
MTTHHSRVGHDGWSEQTLILPTCIGSDDDIARTAFSSAGSYWIDQLGRHAAAARADANKLVRDLTITAAEHRVDPAAEKLRCPGDVRLANMMARIQNYHVKPNHSQMISIWWFIQSALPMIYGADYADRATQIHARFNITRINPFVVVIAERRAGKTWSLVMYLVALALSMPGIKIAIFAAGERSSTWVVEKMLVFMNNAKDSAQIKQRICAQTSTSVSIAEHPLPPGVTPGTELAKQICLDKHTTHVRSYPSTENGKPARIKSIVLNINDNGPRTHPRL